MGIFQLSNDQLYDIIGNKYIFINYSFIKHQLLLL